MLVFGWTHHSSSLVSFSSDNMLVLSPYFCFIIVYWLDWIVFLFTFTTRKQHSVYSDQKPSDLNIQCILERINPIYAGQGLKITLCHYSLWTIKLRWFHVIIKFCRTLRKQHRIRLHINFFASFTFSGLFIILWNILVTYDKLTNPDVTGTLMFKNGVSELFILYCSIFR